MTRREALFLLDRIAVMRDGFVEQLDTPGAICPLGASDYPSYLLQAQASGASNCGRGEREQPGHRETAGR